MPIDLEISGSIDKQYTTRTHALAQSYVEHLPRRARISALRKIRSQRHGELAEFESVARRQPVVLLYRALASKDQSIRKSSDEKV